MWRGRGAENTGAARPNPIPNNHTCKYHRKKSPTDLACTCKQPPAQRIAHVVNPRHQVCGDCLHPGSNPPPLIKDMHVAVCTHSQTRAIIFLQPYRYFVSIAVAHETQTSSFPPDEADSSVICTDTAHPLTSFAPTKTP